MRTHRNVWFWISVALLLTVAGVYYELSSQLQELRDASELQGEKEKSDRSAPLFVWLDGGAGLRITFKRPVIGDSEIGKYVSGKIAELTFHGDALPLFWTSSSSLLYKAEKNFRICAGQQYRLKLAENLRYLDGSVYSGKREYRLKSSEFNLLDVFQCGTSSRLKKAEIAFTFNIPCSANDFEKYLIAPAGVKAKVISSGSLQRHVVSVNPVEDGQEIMIGVKAGMPSGVSDFKLFQREIRRVKVKNKQLAITLLRAGNVVFGERGLSVELNDRVETGELEKNLKISPEVKWNVMWRYENRFYIKGDFKAETLYSLILKKGIESENCVRISDSQPEVVKYPPLRPELRFIDDEKTFLRSGGDMLIPVQTSAIKHLGVRISRIYPNNSVWFLNSDSANGYKYGKEIYKHTFKLKNKADEPVVSYLDLRRVLHDPEPGVYEIYARGGNCWPSDHRRIIITNLAVTAKQAGNQFFIYINKISDSTPVRDASVQIFSSKNQVLAEGKSSGGELFLKVPDEGIEDTPMIIRVTSGKDVCQLRIENNKLSSNGFCVDGMPNPRDGYEAYVYAPRNLYRPGEQVNLFSIVRAVGVKLPEQFPVAMRIIRPDGILFKELPVMLKNNGSCEVECRLPYSARTGWYRCFLALPGKNGKVIGKYKFLVDEFTPDKMKAVIEIPERKYRVGERIVVNASGEYLFGAPVAGGAAKLAVSCYGTEFKPDKYPEYSFSLVTEKPDAFQSRLLASGKLNTDGRIKFPVKAPDWNASTNYRAQFRNTISTPSGGTTNGYKSVPVIKYTQMVGIKYLGEKRPVPGEELKFGYVLLDTETQKRNTGKLRLIVKRINYRWQKSIRNGRTEYKYEQEVKTVETRELLADGKNFNFIPANSGKYIFRLTDSLTGHAADIALYCYHDYSDYIYRSQQNSGGGCDIKKVAISLDKTEYNRGETMQVHLRSPIQGHGYITVESNSVLDFYPFVADAPVKTLSIPVKHSYPFSFNIFAAVSRDPQSKSNIPEEFAYGYAPVRLSLETRTLDVNVEAPEKLRSGAGFELKLKVKDQVIGPVQASVTLALVDEGVCRLTDYKAPSPLDFFYGKRRLDVDTHTVYSNLIEDLRLRQVGISNVLYGGGGVLNRLLRIKRPEERKVIQIWRSDIDTGPDGIATVKLKLPPFSGALRVMAVAFTENSFGSTSRQIKVSDPLTVMPNFPAFIAPEDQVDASIGIFNKTGKDASFRFAVDKKQYSFRLDDGQSRNIAYKIEAHPLPGMETYTLAGGIKEGGNLWSGQVQVLIRSPYSPQVKSNLGMFQAATGETEVSVPGEWLDNSAECSLTVSSAPGLELGDSLEYLVKYPYGCLEQTTSAAFSVMSAPELYNGLTTPHESVTQINRYLQAGVDRILSMQLHNGGFSMWPRGRDVWPWGSVYAADFLLQAKRKGYMIPENTLSEFYSYLQKLSHGKNVELSVYAYYVLSQESKVSMSELSNTPVLCRNNTGWGLYAMALQNVGLIKQARGIVDNWIRPQPGNDRGSGGDLSSKVRDDAVALMALLRLKPESAYIPDLVKSLTAYCRGSRYSTHDAAWSLRALAMYNKTIAAEPSDFKVAISRDGETLGNFLSGQGSITVKFKLNGKNGIQLHSSGEGRVYYRLAAVGIPAKAPSLRDQRLRIRRKILNADGSKADLNNLRFGELYVIKLTLDCRSRIDNLVINDMLPGCFAIENSNLATRTSGATAAFRNSLQPVRIDPRFDRYLIFCDSKEPEKKPVRSYYYAVRASYKGTFVLPPVFSTCMYDPDMYSIASSGTVRVK